MALASLLAAILIFCRTFTPRNDRIRSTLRAFFDSLSFLVPGVSSSIHLSSVPRSLSSTRMVDMSHMSITFYVCSVVTTFYGAFRRSLAHWCPGLFWLTSYLISHANHALCTPWAIYAGIVKTPPHHATWYSHRPIIKPLLFSFLSSSPPTP